MLNNRCNKVLAAAFAAGLGLTFLFPGDIPFINDSPRALKLAWEANQAGRLAAAGLPGSLNVRYHPLAIWLYQGALLITRDLLLIVLVKTMISVGITLGALLAMARHLRLRPWPVAFVLLAPFLYLYQRMLWDNVMLIPVLAALIAAYVWFGRGGGVKALLLMGLSALLMVHLHLTSLVPLSALTAVALWSQRQRLKRHWRALVVIGIAMALVTLPYARHLLVGVREAAPPGTPQTGPWWNGLRGLAGIELFAYPSFYGHFRLAETRLPALLPGIATKWLSRLSLVLVVPTIVGAVAGLRTVWQRRRRGRLLGLREQLVLWACLTLAGNALLFSVFRQQYQPHYHNASWLASFYLLWYGLVRAQGWRPRSTVMGSGLLGLVLLVLLVNHIVYIHAYGGNRHYTYGATLANQLAVAREMVRYPPPPKTEVVNLVHNYRHFPHSYRFLTGLTAVSAPTPDRPAGRCIVISFVKPEDDPYHGWITLHEAEPEPPSETP